MDLIELTVTKIADFAKAIKVRGEIRRYIYGEVKKAIQTSLRDDCIVTKEIKLKLRNSLEEKGLISQVTLDL